MYSSDISSDSCKNNFEIVKSCENIDNIFNEVLGLKMNESNFNKVTFEDVFDIYPFDSDLVTTLKFSKEFHKMKDDRVLFLLVGWKSIDEHLFSRKIKNNNFVIFNEHKLPKDENNMYQLCYYTHEKKIVGVSIPFGFRPVRDDELTEYAMDDDNDSISIIKTRFSVLMDKFANSLKCNQRYISEQMSCLNRSMNTSLAENNDGKSDKSVGSFMVDKDKDSSFIDKVYENKKPIPDSVKPDINFIFNQINTCPSNIFSAPVLDWENLSSTDPGNRKKFYELCDSLVRMLNYHTISSSLENTIYSKANSSILHTDNIYSHDADSRNKHDQIDGIKESNVKNNCQSGNLQDCSNSTESDISHLTNVDTFDTKMVRYFQNISVPHIPVSLENVREIRRFNSDMRWNNIPTVEENIWWSPRLSTMTEYYYRFQDSLQIGEQFVIEMKRWKSFKLLMMYVCGSKSVALNVSDLDQSKIFKGNMSDTPEDVVITLQSRNGYLKVLINDQFSFIHFYNCTNGIQQIKIVTDLCIKTTFCKEVEDKFCAPFSDVAIQLQRMNHKYDKILAGRSGLY